MHFPARHPARCRSAGWRWKKALWHGHATCAQYITISNHCQSKKTHRRSPPRDAVGLLSGSGIVDPRDPFTTAFHLLELLWHRRLACAAGFFNGPTTFSLKLNRYPNCFFVANSASFRYNASAGLGWRTGLQSNSLLFQQRPREIFPEWQTACE